MLLPIADSLWRLIQDFVYNWYVWGGSSCYSQSHQFCLLQGLCLNQWIRRNTESPSTQQRFPSVCHIAGCFHLSRWETLPLVLQGVYNSSAAWAGKIPTNISQGRTQLPRDVGPSFQKWQLLCAHVQGVSTLGIERPCHTFPASQWCSKGQSATAECWKPLWWS